MAHHNTRKACNRIHRGKQKKKWILQIFWPTKSKQRWKLQLTLLFRIALFKSVQRPAVTTYSMCSSFIFYATLSDHITVQKIMTLKENLFNYNHCGSLFYFALAPSGKEIRRNEELCKTKENKENCQIKIINAFKCSSLSQTKSKHRLKKTLVCCWFKDFCSV